MSIIRRKYQPYTENENQQKLNDETDGIILFKFVPAYSIGLYVLCFIICLNVFMCTFLEK